MPRLSSAYSQKLRSSPSQTTDQIFQTLTTNRTSKRADDKDGDGDGMKARAKHIDSPSEEGDTSRHLHHEKDQQRRETGGHMRRTDQEVRTNHQSSGRASSDALDSLFNEEVQAMTTGLPASAHVRWVRPRSTRLNSREEFSLHTWKRAQEVAGEGEEEEELLDAIHSFVNTVPLRDVDDSVQQEQQQQQQQDEQQSLRSVTDALDTAECRVYAPSTVHVLPGFPSPSTASAPLRGDLRRTHHDDAHFQQQLQHQSDVNVRVYIPGEETTEEDAVRRPMPLREAETDAKKDSMAPTSLSSPEEEMWRVQVWVPRRVDALCAPQISGQPSSSTTTAAAATTVTAEFKVANARHYPQPVLWRRQHQSEGERSALRVRSEVEHLVDTRLEAHSLLESATLPSPLSSQQWCVTAYECVTVNAYLYAGLHAGANSTEVAATMCGGQQASRTSAQWGEGIPLICSADPHACESDGSGSISEDEEANEVDEEDGGGAAMPSRTVSRVSLPARPSRRHSHDSVRADKIGGEDDEEEEAAASASPGGVGHRRSRPTRHGGSDTRERRHSSGTGGDACWPQQRHRRVEQVCTAPSRHRLQQREATSSVCVQPAIKLRVTLPWLLHTSALPQAAATLLRRWLDAHVCASTVVQREPTAAAPLTRASPPPFWIAAFAYTHDVQTHVTSFAAGLVHEAEIAAVAYGTAQAGHQTNVAYAPRQNVLHANTAAPLNCIPWPSWVPDARWSVQVLTALTSAAFVLVNDVAHALHLAATTSAAAAAAEEETTKETDQQNASVGVVLRRIRAFRIFSEAIFGDGENKKLCRHARDRLPVHVKELSELLVRPWCALGDVHATARQQKGVPRASSAQEGDQDAEVQASAWNDTRWHPQHPHKCPRAGSRAACCLSSSVQQPPPPPLATIRCPSVLDVIHHLALRWLRQSFPALSDRLHAFLITHDPGVLLDSLSSVNMCESLHDGVYECLNEFVHGLLHRWHRWSLTTTAAAAAAPASSQRESPRPTGQAMQWYTHVNYAKMQSLHWLLQHDVRPRWTASMGDSNAASPPAAAALGGRDGGVAAVVDMHCILEHLTLLPLLLEPCSLLPHEIHSGLRRACAAVPLESQATTNRTKKRGAVKDMQDSFHACFRLFFAMVCYGATVLMDDAVAVVLRMLPLLDDKEKDMTPACPASQHNALIAHEASPAEAAMLSDSLEKANGVWKEWILPLLARYHDSNRDNAGGDEQPEESLQSPPSTAALSGMQAPAAAPATMQAFTPARTPEYQQHPSVLVVADQMILYGLTLLQLVRDAQRVVSSAQPVTVTNSTSQSEAAAAASRRTAGSVSASSAHSSRKRHRHAPADNKNNRHVWQRRRLCTGSEGSVLAQRVEGVDAVDPEGKKDVESVSLCSPRSVSSYTTTATGSVAKCSITSNGNNNHYKTINGCCSGFTGGSADGLRWQGRASDTTTDNCADWSEKRAAGGEGHACEATCGVQRSASGGRRSPQRPTAWVVPSLWILDHRDRLSPPRQEPQQRWMKELHGSAFKSAGEPCAQHPVATAAPDQAWRDECRVAAHHWIARVPPPHHTHALLREMTVPDKRCGGHVLHRRDVRHARAFLLCLRQCVRQVQLRDAAIQKEEEEEGNNGKKALGRVVYDYLYGVRPPGLRCEDGGLLVQEVKPSPLQRSYAHPHRSIEVDGGGGAGVHQEVEKRAACVKGRRRVRQRRDRGVDDTLHLTSTDSMSWEGSTSTEDKGHSGWRSDKEEAAEYESLPSSSTMLVSSLSASSSSLSTSPAQSSPSL